ncbi:MAG: DUF2066 domain-containing protein [Rhizobiales bacterium]|nr:DUF2066 domain-containing protein [Hyphomicrobiales bacterium]
MLSRSFGAAFVAVLTVLTVNLAAASLGRSAMVETGLYTVTGVEVDVTDKDATTARTKAIIEAQVKAFPILAERLGSAKAVERLADLTPQQIGRMLRSLSIEEEHSAPGRYIGKLTVRFLPNKVRAIFAERGLPVVEEQAPPIVVLPVWKSPEGTLVWEDNIWRKAWLDLKAEQAIVPLIVPLGDLQDTQAITPEEALAMDPVKLESIMIRYAAKAILVTIAEPAGEVGIHALMNGNSPLGKVAFDENYQAEEGGLEASAAMAARSFHNALLDHWRSVKLKMAAQAKAEAEAQRAAQAVAAARALPVAVPFRSADEWNAIRQRILSVDGVLGVDVSTFARNGALIKLMFGSSLDDLRSSLYASNLRLEQIKGTWVLQPR